MGLILRYLLAGGSTAAAVITHHTTILLVVVGGYILLLGPVVWTACHTDDKHRANVALRLVLLLVPRGEAALRVLAPLFDGQDNADGIGKGEPAGSESRSTGP